MVEEVREPKRLMAATFVPHQQTDGDLWVLDNDYLDVDKMVVPTKYHEIVDLCRFFYEHDGLAYTTINKQVEIGINGYAINPGTCSKKELKVYESLNQLIENFIRDAALEFLISGLVIPEVTWDRVRGTDIESRFRGSYELPVGLWHRDPLSIDLKKPPLPNRLSVFVTISDDDLHFIQTGGEFVDGTKDRETYNILVEQYKDFVSAVKSGKTVFKLNDPLVIRRYPRSGSVWPTPYLTPALELFMHKRNLRKMDYAIAARVISAIQLFRLGSDEFPLTEDDDDLVDDLKKQMRWRNLYGNTERVFQLFGNHTLEIDWITPDTAALLDEGKYRSINDDIFTALGLPRIVVSGETSKSGTSNANLAMLPPASSIDFMRTQLLEFPRRLYKEIQERNGFKGIPEPYYPPIRLQSLRDLIEIGSRYYELGVISRTGWAEMGGLDFDTEIQRMALEREEMERLNLLERPDVPYAPEPGKVEQNKNNTGVKNGKEEAD